LGETRYKRDSNSFLSAKTLLDEYNCIKILDIDLPVQAIAFETGLQSTLFIVTHLGQSIFGDYKEM
jgi:hypothetical protein